MGGKNSTFDRRNSVERRTQRRVLQNAKIRLQKIEKDLKTFTGIPEDDHHKALKEQLLTLHKDVSKKTATFQPKNRVSGNETLRQIESLLQHLDRQAKTNLEERVKKTYANQIPEEETPTDPEIRKTVEVKVLHVAPQTAEHESTKSPQETRRSILKLGVPVMPNVAKELQRRVSQDKEVEGARLAAELGTTRKEIEDLELDINNFIGTKNGKQYSRFKGRLLAIGHKLRNLQTQEEEIVEQRNLLLKYVDSCLRFLEEKAEGNRGSSSEEEEVFRPNSGVDEDEKKLAKRLAATSV